MCLETVYNYSLDYLALVDVWRVRVYRLYHCRITYNNTLM